MKVEKMKGLIFNKGEGDGLAQEKGVTRKVDT
jgi:hypothetical protein